MQKNVCIIYFFFNFKLTQILDSQVVDLRPTQGVFSAGNVLGSGFTMYETWQISVDLKLRETGADWVQVFQFTSDNAVLYQAGSRVPSVFQPPYPYRKGHRQKKES